MENTFSKELYQYFMPHANETNAVAMKKYMKDISDFFGIKAPQRKALLKEFLSEKVTSKIQKPPLSISEQKQAFLSEKTEYPAIFDTVSALWAMPYRELHYCAIDLLEKQKRHFQAADYLFFEKLLTEKSWWDTVDTLSSQVIAPYFKKFPDQIRPVTERWLESENMWLQRVCLIFQLSYRKETDFMLLTDYILVLKESKQFFIQKAIGWSLRQYARTNPKAVKYFVENTELPPLSIREALKHF